MTKLRRGSRLTKSLWSTREHRVTVMLGGVLWSDHDPRRGLRCERSEVVEAATEPGSRTYDLGHCAVGDCARSGGLVLGEARFGGLVVTSDGTIYTFLWRSPAFSSAADAERWLRLEERLASWKQQGERAWIGERPLIGPPGPMPGTPWRASLAAACATCAVVGSDRDGWRCEDWIR